MTLDEQVAREVLGWTQVDMDDHEHPGETRRVWSSPGAVWHRLPPFSASLDACATYVERALSRQGEDTWAAYGARLAALCDEDLSRAEQAAFLATLGAADRCRAALFICRRASGTS